MRWNIAIEAISRYLADTDHVLPLHLLQLGCVETWKQKWTKIIFFYQIIFFLLFKTFVWNEWQVVDSQIRTHNKQFILINRSNVHVTPPIPNITIKYFEGSHNNPSNVSHIFLSMSKSFALSNWWKLHWYINPF